MGNFKEVLGINEVSSSKVINNLWKALLAEFLGNFLLNFFGCGSVAVMSFASSDTKPNFLLVALTFGVVVFVCVQALGHVSGAHLNPAVTAGMLSVGNIKVIKGVLYIIVQCIGAVAGSATLKALLPEQWHDKLGVTMLNENLTALQGFGFEFFLGFVLVLVVSGVCDPNRPEAKAAGPLAIGMAVALGHMGAITFTGSSMNPARSFGSAVISGVWDNHWVYWIGPIAGGVVAAMVYHHALRAPTLTTVKIIERYSTVADEKELRRLDGNKEDNFA